MEAWLAGVGVAVAVLVSVIVVIVVIVVRVIEGLVPLPPDPRPKMELAKLGSLQPSMTASIVLIGSA